MFLAKSWTFWLNFGVLIFALYTKRNELAIAALANITLRIKTEKQK